MRHQRSMSMKGIKPGNLAAILTVWCMVLLYVLFQGGKTSLMLFSMVSLLAIYLIGFGMGGVNRVKAARTVTASDQQEGVLHAGEQVQVSIQVTVPGLLPMPYLIVREVLKRHNGDSWSFEESVIPNLRGTGELLFQTPALERGHYTFQRTECVSEDIFGLMEHRGGFELNTSFRVLPRTIPLLGWQRQLRNVRGGGAQTTTAASRRETTQINGVRDYVYGDRISRIHWNATAKTGSWKSKEFEHESFPQTLILLDCKAQGYRSTAQFETAVSAAASLLESGAREQAGIGLFTAGKENKLFMPSTSQGERMSMLQHLVDVDADRKESLLSSLERSGRELPKGCLLLIITPEVGEEAVSCIRWAENRGMNPCLLKIAAAEKSAEPGDYTSYLQSRGLLLYTVSSLEELPLALGGRAS
ncbi:DUF58 domain-containing protein [Paenibacillus sp. F411]|uniref:DUF58 domain-containing protein n=1 Tax=Paenibacillus algicola TaxID=2565926 RepID=A0A4P8XID1_9BACL|nr:MULTISPECIES: DUF58 domain-containing protein [Paenibacillus]MBO2943314.1 DUF58 domain-containing protein [Paenibacillus sp. F411]QCT02125.1 hypothetical protein E6C60_1409 [Paenibacillus algicola]